MNARPGKKEELKLMIWYSCKKVTAHAVDLNECLEHIKIPISLNTRATISKLPTIVKYVQVEVTHFIYSNLQYKMCHYFLDIKYRGAYEEQQIFSMVLI